MELNELKWSAPAGVVRSLSIGAILIGGLGFLSDLDLEIITGTELTVLVCVLR